MNTIYECRLAVAEFEFAPGGAAIDQLMSRLEWSQVNDPIVKLLVRQHFELQTSLRSLAEFVAVHGPPTSLSTTPDFSSSDDLSGWMLELLEANTEYSQSAHSLHRCLVDYLKTPSVPRAETLLDALDQYARAVMSLIAKERNRLLQVNADRWISQFPCFEDIGDFARDYEPMIVNQLPEIPYERFCPIATVEFWDGPLSGLAHVDRELVAFISAEKVPGPTRTFVLSKLVTSITDGYPLGLSNTLRCCYVPHPEQIKIGDAFGWVREQ